MDVYDGLVERSRRALRFRSIRSEEKRKAIMSSHQDHLFAISNVYAIPEVLLDFGAKHCGKGCQLILEGWKQAGGNRQAKLGKGNSRIIILQ